MTAFRCTAKLRKLLKATVEPAPLKARSRLGDWSANVVRHGRKPFVLAVAEHSRLALLLPAAPYKTLIDRFTESLPYLLRYLLVPEPLIDAELKAMQPLQIAKTNSRSVLASINQYDFMISCYLGNGESWTTVDLMKRMAEEISKPNDYEPVGDVARKLFGLEPIIGPALRAEFSQVEAEHERSGRVH